MGSAADRFEASLASQTKQVADTGSGFLGSVQNFFTGADRTEFPKMPELGGTDVGGLSGAGYEVLAAMSANEMEQANMAAKMTGGTLAKDKFDNIILVIKDQPFYINKPGVSGRDLKDMGGQAAMFIPAARVAGAAVKTGSVKLLMGSAAASGGTQVGMEAATYQAGADQSLGSAALDTGVATALGPLSAILPFKQTKLAQNLPPYVTQNADTGMDLSRSTGIGLTSSQLGPARHGEAKIQQLREMPQTAYGMDDALNTQSQQIQEAADGVLSALPQARTTPGNQAAEAAQAARDAAVREREEATGALYQSIRNIDGQIDLNPLRNALSAIQRNDKLIEGGNSYQAIERIKSLITQQKKVQKTAPGQADEVAEVDVGKVMEPGYLLSARDDLNGMIQTAVERGMNDQARVLGKAKEQLDAVLSASTNGKFDDANNIYATLSQPINFIDEGLAGMILNMPGDQREYVTKMVFSGSASPNARQNLKRVLDSQDPEAYPALLRAHMEDKLSVINDTALDQNLPANLLNSLWKNKKTRDMYYAELAAVNPDAAQAYQQLGELLKYAKIGRGNNSNTAIKQELADRYKSPLMNVIKRAAGIFTGTSVLGVADDTIVRAMKEADLNKELSTLTGDYREVLNYIASIQPGSRATAESTLLTLQALSAGSNFAEDGADIIIEYK